MRELTPEQRAFLEVHYDQAIDTPAGSAITGNHWFLIAALNELKINVGSIKEAYEVAERLLFQTSDVTE